MEIVKWGQDVGSQPRVAPVADAVRRLACTHVINPENSWTDLVRTHVSTREAPSKFTTGEFCDTLSS